MLDYGANELSPADWAAQPELQARMTRFRSRAVRSIVACCALEQEDPDEVGV